MFLYVCLSFFLAAAAKPNTQWSINAPETNYLAAMKPDPRANTAHEFKDSLQAAANDAHNNARETVDPTAADMLQVSWDNELGQLALEYSKNCVFAHNSQRHHSEFGTPGENIYISYGRSFDTSYVQGAIGSWVAEKAYYDYSSNSCRSGKVCGHYTQVVWSKSYKIGCGATTCDSVDVGDDTWTNATIMVCNYGYAGNYKGQKPYQMGDSCTMCPTPDDTCLNTLCASDDRE